MRQYLRNMRKRYPVDSLFSPVKRSILEATYGQPDRWWYLSELAVYAGKTPSSLQRELKSMTVSGILRTKKDGSRSYFQAEPDSSIFEPLQNLIERSLGIIGKLKESLEPYKDKIKIAFVFGSVARGEDLPSSDVDVIVVGDLGLADLVPAIRPLELRYRRDINLKCYHPDEFTSKMNSGNHFLNSVLAGEKIVLIGDENEFERFGGERLDQTT
jgi:predicted nucleotidyltransferase